MRISKNIIPIIVFFLISFLITSFLMSFLNPVSIIVSEKIEKVKKPKDIKEYYLSVQYKFKKLYSQDYRKKYIDILDNKSIYFKYAYLAEILKDELNKFNLNEFNEFEVLTLDVNNYIIEIKKDSIDSDVDKIVKSVDDKIINIISNAILEINEFNYLSKEDKKAISQEITKRIINIVNKKIISTTEKMVVQKNPKPKKIKIKKEIKKFNIKNIIIFSFFSSICLTLILLILIDLIKYQKNKNL